MRVSVVAPVCNERESIERLVAEVREAMDSCAGEWELILVDDHSRDGSWELLAAASAADERVRSFRLAPAAAGRGGQSAALAAGIRAARGEVVATLDADLQNDPRDLPRLLALLDEGCDFVIGVRAERRDSGPRRLASAVANGVRRLVLRDPFRDIGCSLKVCRAYFLEGLPWFDGMHRYLPVFILRRGARWREIEVSHRPRTHGATKYTIRGRLWRGLHDLPRVRWLLGRMVAPRERQGKSPA
jgi:glycosyltransferase involved in cell wall biosynthesis